MQVLGVTDGVNRPRLISEVWLYTLSCAGGATLYAIFVASLTAVFGEYGASARKYAYCRARAATLLTHSHTHSGLCTLFTAFSRVHSSHGVCWCVYVSCARACVCAA